VDLRRRVGQLSHAGDFRVDHVELLDETLTKSIAVLRQEGLVTLERVVKTA
jgi:hypothetical protein